MNFGNPQKPEIMGQFAGAIMGMAEACKVLDFPVVSGNVSLYNETEGRPILPTPTIGAVGVIEEHRQGGRLAADPGGAGHRADRRDPGLARPVALPARGLRPRGRRPAAGRPRRRTAQRRLRALADRHRPRRGLPRRVGRRPPGGPGGDGHRRRHGHGNRPAGRKRRALARVFLWRGSRPLCHRQRLGRRRDRSGPCGGRSGGAAGLLGRGVAGGQGLLSLPLSDIKAAHEAWLPGYMAATE